MNDASVQPVGQLRLSIVISCFNYRDYVARAIESVLQQEDRRYELLVVDDGSTDGSWDVIRSYAVPKSFCLPNRGALGACLHALSHAEAPFVLFLDADDELVPGSLSCIIPRLDDQVAKLQFALTPIDDHGHVLGAPFPVLPERRDRVRFRRQVLKTGTYQTPPTSGNVLRRDLCKVLEEVDYETSVDGITSFAAPFFGDVVSLSRSLGNYRLHARNFSQSGSRPTAERFQMEADRFLRRHDHLRRLLAARGGGETLAEGASVFFYRERRFYQSILEGEKARLVDVLALQLRLVGMHGPARHRLSLSLFFWLTFVLPRHRCVALLNHRIGLGHRSAWGLLKAVFAPGRAGAVTRVRV